MSSSMSNLHSRLKQLLGGEKGVSTIEWIGLTAVVLVLLSAIVAYVQIHGGQAGAAAGSSMDEQIALWESGGGRVSPYREPDTLGVMSTAPLSAPSAPFECPPGHENVPKPSQQEIDQLIDEAKALLSQTGNGRLIRLFTDLYRIPIEFGESVGMCHFDPIRGKIVIGPAAWGQDGQDRDTVVEQLASCLVHEATHAQRTPLLLLKLSGKILTYEALHDLWSVTGREQDAQDIERYRRMLEYSYSEEYEAFKAEAEFWKELRELKGEDWVSKLDEEETPWYVKQIFDADGHYRSRKDARRDIEAYYVWYLVNCL